MRCLLVIAVLAAACTAPASAPSPNAATADASTDASGLDVSSGTDAAADAGPDVAVNDAESADVAPAANRNWLHFELTDGTSFDGELVATYDTTRWWHPLEGTLYGVFDPRAFKPYPNDRSMRFVLAKDVASMTPTAAPDEPSYRDFLRQNNMSFARPPLDGTNYVVTGHDSYHLEEDGYGNYAWDIERTNDVGQRFTGDGTMNEDYLAWDQPVHSGVAGQVIEVVDNGVDNTPGSHPPTDTAVNNLVGIALGGHYYAYYLHFRENGIATGITVGARVKVGDVLGQSGNAGVSLEPHVHMVLLWYDAPADRSYAIPSEFHDLDVSPGPVGPFASYDWAVPKTGEWIRAR